MIDREKYADATARLAALEAEEKRLTAHLRPQIKAVEAEIDAITDGSACLYVCENCSDPIFEGEQYQNGGDVNFCAKCASTHAECVKSWDENIKADPDAWQYNDFFESREAFDKWLEGYRAKLPEIGDQKPLHIA